MWKFYWFRDNKDKLELIIMMAAAIVTIITENVLILLLIIFLWNMIKFYVLWKISKDKIRRNW